MPSYDDPADQARGFAGGNPDLDPETADTLTVGVVLTSLFASRWLDRLQVSLDWYSIEIDDAIAFAAMSPTFIARCFDPTFNPGFDVANEWCRMFSRDPASGDIVDAYAILRNSAGLRTSGVDLQLDWQLDIGPGELGLQLARLTHGFVRAARGAGDPHHGAGWHRGERFHRDIVPGMEREPRI